MIRIGICEDNLQELNNHKQLVELTMAKFSRNAKIYCFQSGEDLLCEIDATGNMDIILLDIEMAGINGVETARQIREQDNRAILIFISTHDQYYREIIEVQPFSFLDKPVNSERLDEIIQKALKIRNQKEEYYSFSWNKVHYSIPFTAIRYFQSDKRVINMSIVGQEKPIMMYQFYGKLADVEATLSKMGVYFLRVRKSYLINPQYIAEYRANQIVLDTGESVEISKQYKDSVKQYYITMLKERKWK